MGGNPKIGGTPPNWMVKIMENPIKHGMIWGENPLFSETPICQRMKMTFGWLHQFSVYFFDGFSWIKRWGNRRDLP